MSVCERKIGARENFQPLGLRSETNIEKVSEINIFQKQITWEVAILSFLFFIIFYYFFIFSTLHYISLALECNLGCVCFDFKSLPKIFFTKCGCLVAHEK